MQRIKHINAFLLQVSAFLSMVAFIYQGCLVLGNRIYSRKFFVTYDLGFMDMGGENSVDWKIQVPEGWREHKITTRKAYWDKQLAEGAGS